MKKIIIGIIICLNLLKNIDYNQLLSDSRQMNMVQSGRTYFKNNTFYLDTGYKQDIENLVKYNIILVSGETFIIENPEAYYNSWNYVTINEIEIFILITDVNGNYTNVSCYLHIIDGRDPEFFGIFDYYVSTSEYITLEKIKENLVCYDEEIGYIDPINWKISINTYEKNNKVPGIYYIRIEASDNTNIGSIDINIHVADDIKPTIQNESGCYITNFDNPYSLKEIKSWFTAYDETDGDITSKIVFETNYPSDLSLLKPGNYLFKISVMDNSQNESTFIMNLYVIDNKAPNVISQRVIVHNNNLLSTKEILKKVKAIDNFDGEIPIEEEHIIQNTYEGSTKIGDYFIDIEVSDSSSNKTTHRIVVQIIDKINPIINLKSDIFLSSSKLSTEEFIRNYMEATDETDGDITNKIKINLDNYKKNFNKIGEYVCYAMISDNAGNEYIKEFIVHVFDDKSPIIYIKDFITITNDIVLTEDKLIEILKNMSGIKHSDTSICNIETNYFKTPTAVGVYEVILTMTDYNFNENPIVFRTNINVISKRDDNNSTINLKKTKWYKRFLKLIKNTIKKIFRKIF